ncbi:pyridoxamine 5'-phosphate oxidase family protein [Acidimicrobiaceae bacterium]|jgi:PPOX class probable F420-dependent enzyme|nr:pyridoxamine 5'-phosphate oxidase family protein [Candidatus Actinomarina sp.]MDC0077308.1 pyridoxamine 5'-phosphate oxidase family protein [Acidimicrobiaceae bacterium]|tara:strand:- start:3139 stop:3549 length:411 start_codon:yes stop_codon:yes gene_type:complete
MQLDNKTIKMATEPNYAALTTLFKNGVPQTHVMWVDTDGENILINTEIHRVKYKNVKIDPRVTVMIWKHDNPFKFVEIRGEVIGEITGQEARDNIDKLSEKYWNKPYPFPIQTERIVLIIKSNKEVTFNLKDEDFE